MACAVLAAWGALASPAESQTARPTEVDVELVLAVDVSRSMNFSELRLQRDGYVAAFRHPDVIRAIGQGLIGRIAVTYFDWAGPGQTRVVVPWTIITDASDANAFADALAENVPFGLRGTSISGGLVFARGLLADNDISGLRRIIDVSGDGPNNTGEPVTRERDRTIAEGIVVNGLAIDFGEDDFDTFSIPNLDVYYEDCVVGGPGAFVIPVNAPTQFEVAIRRKLVLEIAGVPARLIPAQFEARRPTDCLIGEKLYQRWFRLP